MSSNNKNVSSDEVRTADTGVLKGVGIFDFEPGVFGYTLQKSAGIKLILAIFCLVLFQFLPLGSLSVPGRNMLGIVIASMLVWSIKEIPQTFGALLAIVLCCVEGLMNYGDIVKTLGTTPFLMLMCLLIFSTGMSNTKMAERISYSLIRKLGTSPFALVAALFITEVILSALIANMPALLVLAAVAVGILKELGEKPGESKFGAAVMISITLASLVGGCCLVSSSGQNPTVIAILETATNGEYTITYNQWAAVGIPFAIVMTIITLIIVRFMFKLDKKHTNISLSLSRFIGDKEVVQSTEIKEYWKISGYAAFC